MAIGVEEFDAISAMAKLKEGFKRPYPVEANQAPELRFVEGLGPNYLQVHGGPVHDMKTMDPWVTRYPNAKL